MILSLSIYTSIFLWVCASTSEQSFKLKPSFINENLKEECDSEREYLTTHYVQNHCFSIWSYPEEYEMEKCDYWALKNLRGYRDITEEPMQRAVYQYCKGATSLRQCFDCFNSAVEHFWFRNPCDKFGHTKGVPKCLQEYPNKKFQWSTDVILKNGTKTVHVVKTELPYSMCRDRFTKLIDQTTELKMDKDFDVKFPLKMPKFRKEGEEEYNMMLSLYLNAFELNNPKGETLDSEGFRCDDFADLGYLHQYYHRVIIDKITTSSQLTEAYKKLREDMCSKDDNSAECVKCFDKGDKLFLPNLKNQNLEVRSFISEFTEILTVYQGCLKSHKIVKAYKDILTDTHEGLEKLETKNCKAFHRRDDEDFNNNTSLFNTEHMEKKSKVVIESVMFNVYTHMAYGVRHGSADKCGMMESECVGCLIYYTKLLAKRLRDPITDSDEDNALNEYSRMLSSRCDSYGDVYKYE